MTDQEIYKQTLAGTGLFGGLPDADLAAVAGLLRRVSFAPGQLIFSRGDLGQDIFIVTEGRVRLSIPSLDARELSLIHATAGELFGEIAALDNGPRTADATAIGAVKALILPQAALKRLLGTNPRISGAAVRFLCTRVRETNEKLETIALYPIEVRVARFLVTALRLRGDTTSATVTFDLAMSQGELALLVGASRPKVNIALTLLEEAGALKRDGTKITCTVARLESLARLDSRPSEAFCRWRWRRCGICSGDWMQPLHRLFPISTALTRMSTSTRGSIARLSRWPIVA